MLVIADSGCAMSLGKFFPVGSMDHGHMAKNRGHVTQRAVHGDLLGSIRDVIVAAEHVGDLHVDVVDDHGEVVERRAVRPENHEVTDVLALEADTAMYRVLPR